MKHMLAFATKKNRTKMRRQETNCSQNRPTNSFQNKGTVDKLQREVQMKDSELDAVRNLLHYGKKGCDLKL